MLHNLHVPKYLWPFAALVSLVGRVLGVVLGLACFILGMGMIMSVLAVPAGLLLFVAGFTLIINCLLP